MELTTDVNEETKPNEQTGSNAAHDSDSLLKKISDAGSAAFKSVAGVVKRGRGRPRKVVAENPGEGPGAIVENEAILLDEGAAGLPTDVDPSGDGLLIRSVVSAFKGTIGLLKAMVRIKAGAADIDRGFTDRTLEAHSPNEEALQEWGKSFEAVAKKYDLKSEYSPEFSLAVNTGTCLAPFVLMWRSFDEEIARRRRKEGGAV